MSQRTGPVTRSASRASSAAAVPLPETPVMNEADRTRDFPGSLPTSPRREDTRHYSVTLEDITGQEEGDETRRPSHLSEHSTNTVHSINPCPTFTVPRFTQATRPVHHPNAHPLTGQPPRRFRIGGISESHHISETDRRDEYGSGRQMTFHVPRSITAPPSIHNENEPGSDVERTERPHVKTEEQILQEALSNTFNNLQQNINKGIDERLRIYQQLVTTEVNSVLLPARQYETNVTELRKLIEGISEQTHRAVTNSYHGYGVSKQNETHLKTLIEEADKIKTQITSIEKQLKSQSTTLDIMNEILQAIEHEVSNPKEPSSSDDELPEDPLKGISKAKQSFMRPRTSTQEIPRRQPTPFTTRNEQTLSEPHIPSKARAKKPEPFSGKRGLDADIFLMKMELYFDDYADAFDDNRKISTTLSNMGEGDGSKWAQPLLRKWLDKELHTYFLSWKNFKAGFTTAFSDPVKKERAIREINTLKQTTSAQQYATQFRLLKDEIGWDEMALIDKYKGGLKTNVQQELMRIGINMDTTALSLEQWIEQSIKIDDVLYASAKINMTPNGARTYPNKSRPNQGNTMPQGGTPKERVPKETIDRRKKEGSCLKCGNKGHMAKECRKGWTSEPSKKVPGKAAEEKEEKLDDSESTSTKSEN